MNKKDKKYVEELMSEYGRAYRANEAHLLTRIQAIENRIAQKEHAATREQKAVEMQEKLIKAFGAWDGEHVKDIAKIIREYV